MFLRNKISSEGLSLFKKTQQRKMSGDDYGDLLATFVIGSMILSGVVGASIGFTLYHIGSALRKNYLNNKKMVNNDEEDYSSCRRLLIGQGLGSE